MPDVSEMLAEFAVKPVNVSLRARKIIRLSLLDWLSCGLAGIDEPVAKITRDMVLAEGGAGAAAIFGGGSVPARAAALVNGTTSHALDFDDTHFLHIGHPSVVIFPAALAVAQQVNASGQVFLDACAIGFEASARLGAWLGRGHYETGFHQTATAGSFGATLAAGRLLGLSAEQLRHAIGVNSTRSSGLKSQFGTMGKPYNAGIAAANGVEAATLTARGFISRPDGLECGQGFGVTHAGVSDMDAFVGLGQDWVTETVSHKFHACCHGTHAALEALSVAARSVEVEEITAVKIRANPRWARVCNIGEPATGLEAKFSYRLTAAMMLAGIDTGLAGSFTGTVCSNPDILKIRDRVRVEFDANVSDTAARVVLETAQGPVEAEFDLSNPVETGVLESRLLAKAEALTGGSCAGTACDAIDALPDAPDVAGITPLLAGKTG